MGEDARDWKVGLESWRLLLGLHWRKGLLRGGVASGLNRFKQCRIIYGFIQIYLYIPVELDSIFGFCNC